MMRGQVPPRGHVRAAAPSFGEHFFAYQQPEFDADSGKPNALPTHFRAGGDVVILPHLFPLHAGAVVGDGQCGLCRVCGHRDPVGPGIQRIGDDFGQDGFFEARWVGIPQVFQQMFKIDAGLAHVLLHESALCGERDCRRRRR